MKVSHRNGKKVFYIKGCNISHPEMPFYWSSSKYDSKCAGPWIEPRDDLVSLASSHPLKFSYDLNRPVLLAFHNLYEFLSHVHTRSFWWSRSSTPSHVRFGTTSSYPAWGMDVCWPFSVLVCVTFCSSNLSVGCRLFPPFYMSVPAKSGIDYTLRYQVRQVAAESRRTDV